MLSQQGKEDMDMSKLFFGAVVLSVVATNVFAGPSYQSSHKANADVTYSAIAKSSESLSVSNDSLYVGVISGISISKIGKDQTDKTAGLANGYAQYLPTSNYKTTFLYGLNSGYEFKFNSNWMLSLGLGLYQNTNHSSKGDVWFVYEPDSRWNEHTLSYEYNFRSTRLMAELQIGHQFNLNKFKLIPFVSIGVGPSFNSVSGYSESAVAKNASVINGFGDNTTTDLAYQVGAGIACPFNDDHDRLSIAYRYGNFGKTNLDVASGYPDYKLDTGKITAHEVYIGYTHLFNI